MVDARKEETVLSSSLHSLRLPGLLAHRFLPQSLAPCTTPSFLVLPPSLWHFSSPFTLSFQQRSCLNLIYFIRFANTLCGFTFYIAGNQTHSNCGFARQVLYHRVIFQILSNSILYCSYIYLVCSVSVCARHIVSMKTSGQCAGFSFLCLPRGLRRGNSGWQVWWQVPLLIKPSLGSLKDHF